MKEIIKYTIALSLLLTSACIDPIEFEVPAEFSDSLVIQGKIVKGEPSYVEVNINRLYDFTPESRAPVNVAQVFLFDEAGTEMELTTRVPGRYRQVLDQNSPIQPEVGKGYRIRVRALDGRTIDSELDFLPPNIGPQRLNITGVEELVINQFDDFVSVPKIQLSVDTEIDLNSGGGLFWDIRSVFQVTDSGLDDEIIRTCWIDRITNVNDIYVLDPSLFSNNQVNDYELARISINNMLNEGYYFVVRQSSLSPTAFEYMRGIDILSEREGNVFDRPVGEVPSNLTNVDNPEEEVFGYFFSTEEKVLRERVPENLYAGVPALCPTDNCFIPGNPICVCGYCCDCRKEEGSTTERPSFFE